MKQKPVSLVHQQQPHVEQQHSQGNCGGIRTIKENINVHINGEAVEMVQSLKLLKDDLSCFRHTPTDRVLTCDL